MEPARAGTAVLPSPDEHAAAMDDAERLVRHGHLSEGEVALEALWELLDGEPAAVRGRCQALLALLYDNQGQLARAMLASYQAIELFGEAGDDVGLTRVLTLAAVTSARIGDGPQAFELLGQAQRLCATVPADDAGTHFRLHNNKGIVHQVLGDHRLAVECADSGLQVALRGGDERMLAHARCMAVWSRMHAAHAGDQVDAGALAELVERSHALVREYAAAGYTHLVSEGLRVNGTAHHALGRLEASRACLVEALAVAEQGDHRTEQVTVRLVRGRTERTAGDVRTALAHLTAALALAEQLGEPMKVVQAHEALSETYEQAGDLALALLHHRSFHRAHVEVLRTNSDTRAQLLSVRLEAERARREAEELRSRTATLEERNQELARDAHEDPLTRLGNRRHLAAVLAALAERPDEVVLAIADLDLFKQVNDVHSHAVGDDVLREVAGILRLGCRPDDVVVRYGGEEFVLTFVGASLGTGAAAAERLRAAVQSHDWSAVSPGLHVTVSIGVAANRDGERLDVTLARADTALYAAKASGRNAVRCA